MATLEEAKQFYETAVKLREEGNAFYKEGKFREALAKYTKMPLWLNGLNPNVPEVSGMAAMMGKAPVEFPADFAGQIKDLRIAGAMNAVMCCLKMNDKLPLALDMVNKALELDGQHPKARYRRGQVYLAMGDLDKAREDLSFAKTAFPTDRAVHADWQKLAEKQKETDKRAASQWKGIFASKPASAPAPAPAAPSAAPAPEASSNSGATPAEAGSS